MHYYIYVVVNEFYAVFEECSIHIYVQIVDVQHLVDTYLYMCGDYKLTVNHVSKLASCNYPITKKIQNLFPY